MQVLQDGASTEKITRSAVFALALLLLLAAGVRLYNIFEQPVWIDEFDTIVHDPTASFEDHMAYAMAIGPDQFPTYYAYAYWFGRAFGYEPWKLRLSSVFFSLLTICIVFGLARRIFGNGPAIVAGVLFAISPTMSWYAQSIRMYALLLLCVMTAVTALYQAVETGRPRWWLVNAVANAIALASHLSTLFVFPAQGLFLLLFVPFRTAFIWAAAHFALALLALSRLPLFDVLPNLAYFDPVDPISWLTDLLADDGLFNISVLDPATHPDRAWLVIVLSLAVIVGLWRVLSAPKGTPLFRGGVLLALVAIVPFLMITLVHFFAVPVVHPRYTLYCIPPLFALAAWGVFSLKRQSFRLIVIVVLLSSFAPVLRVFLFEGTRPDLGAAARYLRRHVNGPDTVAVLDFNDEEMGAVNLPQRLRFHMGETKFSLHPMPSLQAAAEAAVEHFKTDTRASSDYWVVSVPLIPAVDPEEQCELLKASGLDCTFEWLSIYLVYRLRATDGVTPRVEAVSLPQRVDLQPLISTLPQQYQDEPERTRITQVLRRNVDWGRLPITHEHLARIASRVYLEDRELGIAFASQALELEDGSALVNAFAGTMLYGIEEYERARPLLRNAVAIRDQRIRPFERLLTLLAEDRLEEAREEVLKLTRIGNMVPAIFFDVLELPHLY